MRWITWFWVAIVLLRMGYVLVAPSVDPFLRNDSLHGDARLYDTIAWVLANEGRFEYEKRPQTAPAYLWLMAGVYWLVGHDHQAIRVVNGLLGLLTLWGIWRLANRWLGDRFAYWVVGLSAVHPHLLMISGWLYTENLVLPLVVWAVERATAGWNWRNACWCGVLVGFLALTKASFLPFVGVIALWGVLTSSGGQYTLKSGFSPLRSTLIFILTTVLLIVPYVGWLWAQSGHFIPIALGGYVFLEANNPEAGGGFRADDRRLRMRVWGQEVFVQDWIADPDFVVRDRKAFRLAVNWISENPADFIRLLWLKTRLSLSAFGMQASDYRHILGFLRVLDSIYWFFLIIAMTGMVYGWRGNWREFSLPVFLIGWVWLTIWVYAGGSRSLLPAQPFLTLFFVRGMVLLMSRFHRK